jgi:hypothetical protein
LIGSNSTAAAAAAAHKLTSPTHWKQACLSEAAAVAAVFLPAALISNIKRLPLPLNTTIRNQGSALRSSCCSRRDTFSAG